MTRWRHWLTWAWSDGPKHDLKGFVFLSSQICFCRSVVWSVMSQTELEQRSVCSVKHTLKPNMKAGAAGPLSPPALIALFLFRTIETWFGKNLIWGALGASCSPDRTWTPRPHIVPQLLSSWSQTGKRCQCGSLCQRWQTWGADPPNRRQDAEAGRSCFTVTSHHWTLLKNPFNVLQTNKRRMKPWS